MAAGKWKLYEKAKLNLENGTFDLDTNSFKVGLFLSASNANTLSGSEVLADLTNEHAGANGYTAGGQALASATLANAAGTITFDAADPVWTAAGGSITARFAVIYAVGTLNGKVNPLLCVCLLDTTPADVTATSGNTLTLVLNASGIFTLSGAAVD